MRVWSLQRQLGIQSAYLNEHSARRVAFSGVFLLSSLMHFPDHLCAIQKNTFSGDDGARSISNLSTFWIQAVYSMIR